MCHLKKNSGTHFVYFSGAPLYQVASGCGKIPAGCHGFHWIFPVSFGQILRLSLLIETYNMVVEMISQLV
jgi:hypothetical protein